MTPLSATQGLSYQLSASRKTPTILIIPTLLHTPAHYGPLCWYLETQGYSSSFALLLPSSRESSNSNSSNGMAEDVAAIRRVLEELVVKNEEDVVVVMHGYGAVPGCKAVTADLGREARVKEGMGKSGGGVTGLVLIGGWLVEEGESIEGTIRGLGLGEEVEVRNFPTPLPRSILKADTQPDPPPPLPIPLNPLHRPPPPQSRLLDLQTYPPTPTPLPLLPEHLHNPHPIPMLGVRYPNHLHKLQQRPTRARHGGDARGADGERERERREEEEGVECSEDGGGGGCAVSESGGGGWGGGFGGWEEGGGGDGDGRRVNLWWWWWW